MLQLQQAVIATKMPNSESRSDSRYLNGVSILDAAFASIIVVNEFYGF